MFLERSRLAAKLVSHTQDLGVEALLGRGQKATEAELVSLLIREASVLIRERVRDNAMVSELARSCSARRCGERSGQAFAQR